MRFYINANLFTHTSRVLVVYVTPPFKKPIESNFNQRPCHMYLLDIFLPQRVTKLLNSSTQKIHVLRDIIFQKIIFRFAMTKYTAQFTSFPFHSTFLNDYPLSYNDTCGSSPSPQNDQDQIHADDILVNAPAVDITSS